MQLDVIDILSEVLNRFGQFLSKGSNGPQLQKSIQDTLFPLLNHSRAAVRKRATGAIGNLVTHLPDDLFNDLVKKLLAELKQNNSPANYDKLRTYIGCIATLRSEYRPAACDFGYSASPAIIVVIAHHGWASI